MKAPAPDLSIPAAKLHGAEAWGFNPDHCDEAAMW